MVVKELIRSLLYFVNFKFNKNRHSKVLYYHDVGCKYTDMGTPFDMIKHHIEIIRKHKFTIVTNISEKDNQVMIAFDDGWRGIYEFRDFFFREKIFPTIFIAVDLIGKPGYLSVDQIKELSNYGFVFQAHTWSHRDLTSYSLKELKHELSDSKIELERIIGTPINSICFPQGRFSDLVINESINSGYKYLYSSIGGHYSELIRYNIICRYLIQSVSPSSLGYLLEGGSKLLSKKNLRQHYLGQNIII